MMKRLYKPILVCFFFFSIIVLFSPKVSPAYSIIFAILSLLIPAIAALNGLLLLIFLFWRSKLSILPGISIVIFSFLYLQASLSFNSWADKPRPNTLSVFSYNVSQFLKPRHYYFDHRWKDGDSLLIKPRKMIDYIADYNADIKCIQEYYTDSNSSVFNTKERISHGGKFYTAESTQRLRINQANFGVSIFSRYPIVNSGELIYSNNAFNRGVYADLKIGADTIRVINVHLQSTQIGFSLTRKFFSKWKYDQKQRAKQADMLLSFIDKTTYPVILCGDMNATPYGYVYSRFSQKLTNSYESKGHGVGYTFTGKGVKYLRIDHQFTSREFEAEMFFTDHSIHFSDHYPNEGVYRLH